MACLLSPCITWLFHHRQHCVLFIGGYPITITFKPRPLTCDLWTPKSKTWERHLFIHGWSRLLLFCRMDLNHRLTVTKNSCSTTELQLTYCDVLLPLFHPLLRNKIQHALRYFSRCKRYLVVFQVIAPFRSTTIKLLSALDCYISD